MDSQSGLKWEPSWFSEPVPVWTIEPDIELLTELAREALKLPESIPCIIEFLAQGTFNKVYTITCGGLALYVLRVSLPVQPRFKTMSEQATINYVRHHTNTPAPQVIFYEAANNNKLGFEWMIISKVPGAAMEGQWHQVSWLTKGLWVRQMAAYLAQLFQSRFLGIGNLFMTSDLQQLPSADISNALLLGMEFSSETSGFCLGEIVSVPFFTNDHLMVDMPRGPFKNSQDWLVARIMLHIHDVDNASSSEDEDDDDERYNELRAMNTPEAIKSRAQRLLNLLPRIFASDDVEEYVLHHHDLNSNNIITDSNHNIAGIIDWECISTCPVWLACEIPEFLDGVERSECPDPDEWPISIQDDGREDRNCVYYEQLEEYQKTQLRRFFLEEMNRISPAWVQAYIGRKRKADFEQVVALFGVGSMGKAISKWLDAVEKGESPAGI
ncbi:phosphotransferase enzyme family-domain-containing protein [Pyrenochaeta sp. MPI-SDFR-AT-0127]|nr:phosphotransferase enzyme family-domain-containing protein [Pyrenochaeta sp. MPI-SDFR-AT-0127]